MKRTLFVLLSVLTFCACNSSKKNEDEQRWPDFLREWAEYEGIDAQQRLSIFDQIDSAYRFFEDTTLSMDAYTDMFCRLVKNIQWTVENDTSYPLVTMMRATANNMWQYTLKDERYFDCECLGNLIGTSAIWNTFSSSEVEGMTYTLLPVSWLSPWHSAHIVIGIAAGSETPFSMIIVNNFADEVMDIRDGSGH